MRLFQLASMKMGLDKVVMNGVENGDVSYFYAFTYISINLLSLFSFMLFKLLDQMYYIK
jgi:hypothetical protein